MISFLAQILVIATKVDSEPDPKKITAAPSVYRTRCCDCDEEGRDARLPCEGH